MGSWSFYFFAKIGLYWARVIDFNVWLNLAFGLLLCIPVPRSMTWFKPWRQALAVLIGLALFWYDSGWPSPLRLVTQFSDLSQFSGSYWIELITRLWSWQMLVALLLGIALFRVLRNRVRLGVVSLVLMLLLPVLPWPKARSIDDDAGTLAAAASASSPALAGAYAAPVPVTAASSGPAGAQEPPLDGPQLDQQLKAFYDEEQHKVVKFPDTKGAPPFDLLFLSICSLSWDDLTVAGLQDAPLLRRMDLLFRQFNSAASYSGPAVLRLLHGTCGQTPQSALYDSTNPDCYLFEQLSRMGYRDALLLNHEGNYDHFSEQLQRQGGMNVKPSDHSGASVAMTGFDGSPIYDDYDVLSRWWKTQTTGTAASGHFAALYNTISLHDGNRLKGQPGSTNTLLTWPTRARNLFGDIEHMLPMIEQSGRPTVVVLIPEHGASLRGDNTQIPGLREFPTPRVTHVPAGVALLNMGPKPVNAEPVMVDQVSSYVSLTAVISALLASQGSPYDALRQVGGALPPTPWVAENDGTIVFSQGGRNYMRNPDGRWTR